jgi:putative transcriptional regulator
VCIAVAIIIRLDRILVERKMKLYELAETIGISNVNLSNLKTGKVRAIRFSTLDAICKALNCQPGDILEHVSTDDNEEEIET